MSSVNPYAAPQGSQHIPEPRAIPMNVREILVAGTSLFVNYFPTWAMLSLVVWVPLELATSYFAYFVLDAEDVLGTLRMDILFEAIFGIIVVGGITQLGYDAWRGEPISWTRGLAAGLASWPRLFSTRLIGGIVTALGLVLFIIPGLYVAVRIALADAVSVLEHKAGTQALPRSMDLTYRKFLRYLLLSFATYVPVIILASVHQLPLAYWPQIDHWLVSAALTLLIDLAAPWLVLVFVVAYISETAEEAMLTSANIKPMSDVTSTTSNGRTAATN
jgi:hypothetical protein